MNADQFIAARVSSVTKAQLRLLADRQQLSESALLKRLVEMTIHSAGDLRPNTAGPAGKGARAARLYVRLRPDDRLLLAERAAARGMPGATYVSVLVRAHLRSLTPIPRDELLALKRSVAELSALGRNLNQIARLTNQGGRAPAPGREHTSAMLRICEALRDNFKALLKVNAASWEQGYGEPNP